MTPTQHEAATILEADIRVRLEGEVITPAKLRAALIESARALSPPLTLPINVEHDPADANRLNATAPASSFYCGSGRGRERRRCKGVRAISAGLAALAASAATASGYGMAPMIAGGVLLATQGKAEQ